MTGGHIVGLDPMTDRIVVLRKGQDGKASRQVDVLTNREAWAVLSGLQDALKAQLLARRGKPVPDGVPITEAAAEPEQAAFDLDHLTEGNTPA